MLKVNGVSPTKILYNGTDLMYVYCKASSSSSPVLVWAKEITGINTTGSNVYTTIYGNRVHVGTTDWVINFGQDITSLGLQLSDIEFNVSSLPAPDLPTLTLEYYDDVSDIYTDKQVQLTGSKALYNGSFDTSKMMIYYPAWSYIYSGTSQYSAAWYALKMGLFPATLTGTSYSVNLDDNYPNLYFLSAFSNYSGSSVTYDTSVWTVGYLDTTSSSSYLFNKQLLVNWYNALKASDSNWKSYTDQELFNKITPSTIADSVSRQYIQWRFIFKDSSGATWRSNWMNDPRNLTEIKPA